MAQDTYVNGNRFSFVNVSIELTDFTTGNTGISGGIARSPRGVFKSINYSAKQDPGIVQGNQVAMVGRTSGYGTADGACEILLSDFNDISQTMTSGGQVPLFDVDFNVLVQYSINDVDVVTDHLIGCRFTSADSNNQQGSDASTVQCNLSIAAIVKDGVAMFRSVENF